MDESTCSDVREEEGEEEAFKDARKALKISESPSCACFGVSRVEPEEVEKYLARLAGEKTEVLMKLFRSVRRDDSSSEAESACPVKVLDPDGADEVDANEAITASKLVSVGGTPTSLAFPFPLLARPFSFEVLGVKA